MSENTPNNPSQGASAAGGYGYDAGAHRAGRFVARSAG